MQKKIVQGANIKKDTKQYTQYKIQKSSHFYVYIKVYEIQHVLCYVIHSVPIKTSTFFGILQSEINQFL